MDKLMDSRLFMKLVALALAILLFVTVNFEAPNQPAGTTSRAGVETMKDVPVTVIYDEENLVVSGVPETITVTIEGPSAIVQSTKTLRNFEVFVDLSEAEIGEKRFPMQMKDISDKLKVTMDPPYANVSVQEKVTKEFKVEAEFNQSMIEEGYYAGRPQVDPSTVTVTGAKDIVDQITYVKATIENRGKINDSITREATVLVLDEALNKLPVVIEPETVQVTLPVKSSDKLVPIEIKEEGTLAEGITIDAIELEETDVTITAATEVLEQVSAVEVILNLSTLTEDVELEVPIIVPDQVIKIDPETVKIHVRVIKEEEVAIENVPIETVGLGKDLDLSFLDPTDGKTTVTTVGPSDQVQALTAADLKLTVDAKDLSVGEHELTVKITGPEKLVFDMGHKKIKVTIVEKET